MARTNFVENPVWSGISEGYSNSGADNDFIAEMVLPTVQVSAEIFNADYMPPGQFLVAPDNVVGRLNRPPTLNFQALQRQFSTQDTGYDAPIPNFDIERAEQQRRGGNTGFNPESAVIEGLNEVCLLRRELRAASLVFNLNTYLPTQRQTVLGPSQWNQVGSRPLDQMRTVMDNMLQRPNTLILNQQGWTALTTNPSVVEAALGTSAREGVASKQKIAELLEIKNIYVGTAWTSASAEQDLERTTESTRRVWGNNAALVYLNPSVRSTTGSNQFTFGYTARWGTKKSGYIEDPDMGVRGGRRARVYESTRELVTASFCGYYFQGVLSASANLTINNFL